MRIEYGHKPVAATNSSTNGAKNREVFGVRKGPQVHYFSRYLDAVVHKHEIKATKIFKTEVVTK